MYFILDIFIKVISLVFLSGLWQTKSLENTCRYLDNTFFSNSRK